MGFKVPPQDDFDGYSKLVLKQRDHFGALGTWSAGQCSNGSGLDGLLYPLRGPIAEVGGYFHGKFVLCGNGMTGVSDKVLQARAAYSQADQHAADRLAAAYPAPLRGFHEITDGPLIGSFDDTDVTLKEPASAEEDTQHNISLQLHLITTKLVGGELAGAEHVFKFLTGQSLVELLLTPLVGKYGRLKYLQEAYEQLNAGAYEAAGNLRRGTLRMAVEWNGDAATAFESYMFRWHMGTGGLGDAAKIVAGLFRDGYLTVTALVWAALKEINTLMDDGVKKLAEEAAQMVAGDAAIEAVGLGPEDPLADIGAGIWSAWKLYKIYKIVRMIISTIMMIEEIFKEISKAVDEIGKGIAAVRELMNSPAPSIDDIMNTVEQRGTKFEEDKFWNPKLGATRIGLLPTA